MKLSTAGVVGYSVSGWLGAMANQTASNSQRRKSCILLWMNGGPSQMDTFDLRPNHANGGPFKEIATATPGIGISEHLPKIAKFMDQMAIIKSMDSRDVDHGTGTYFMHTGYNPRGPIRYPSIGSIVASEVGTDEAALPNYVSIAPFRQFNGDFHGSGFLGPKYAPLMVGEFNYYDRNQNQDYDKLLRVADLESVDKIARDRFDARLDLLQELEEEFVRERPGTAAKSHKTAYDRAVKLMRTAASKAFNLDEEPAKVRDAYGRNIFGQGCLLARRLVEQGVPFVEVTLGSFQGNNLGWDTHQNNFESVKALSNILDPAWANLMEDLKARGLLDSTLIVWSGEFGRTPKITGNRNGGGREHWAKGWSTVMAGGGIRGGQTVGRMSASGETIEDRPVSTPDFMATIAKAMGIDHMKQNMSNVGRPIRVADPTANATPIKEIVG